MSLWDTNWETSHGVGKLTRRAFNQLRSACQERCTGAGRTIPALIASDVPKYGRVTKACRTALHNEVSALITLYVNHLLPTATPGNYNGETTIPVFSEATILSAIGDASRLPIPNDHLNCAAWNWQTKRILNLLRWAKKIPTLVQKEYKGPVEFADWDSTPWASLPSGTLYARAYKLLTEGYGNYSRIKSTFNLDFTWSAGSILSDSYIYLIPADIFTNELGTYPNAYNNAYSDNFINFNGNTEVLNIGNIATAPAGGDALGVTYGWQMDTGYPMPIIILKFTGANGFQHLD